MKTIRRECGVNSSLVSQWTGSLTFITAGMQDRLSVVNLFCLRFASIHFRTTKRNAKSGADATSQPYQAKCLHRIYGTKKRLNPSWKEHIVFFALFYSPWWCYCYSLRWFDVIAEKTKRELIAMVVAAVVAAGRYDGVETNHRNTK